MKFLILIIKGVVRNQHTRRTTMFIVVIAALVVLFAGATFLSGWLAENPVIFLVYWAGCGWITLGAVLLALYDLLAVRLQLRRERETLKKEIFGNEKKGGKE